MGISASPGTGLCDRGLACLAWLWSELCSKCLFLRRCSTGGSITVGALGLAFAREGRCRGLRFGAASVKVSGVAFCLGARGLRLGFGAGFNGSS